MIVLLSERTDCIVRETLLGDYRQVHRQYGLPGIFSREGLARVPVRVCPGVGRAGRSGSVAARVAAGRAACEVMAGARDRMRSDGGRRRPRAK